MTDSKTATERLGELLKERGVEYRFNETTKLFEWHFDGTDGEGSAHATEVNGGINIIACSLTPEQAIAATLGDDGVGRSNDGVATLGSDEYEGEEMTMRVTREEFVGSAEWETMEEYLSNAETAGKLMQRPDGTRLFCPFTGASTYCGTWCPMCLYDGIESCYCGLPLGRSERMEEVGM